MASFGVQTPGQIHSTLRAETKLNQYQPHAVADIMLGSSMIVAEY